MTHEHEKFHTASSSQIHKYKLRSSGSGKLGNINSVYFEYQYNPGQCVLEFGRKEAFLQEKMIHSCLILCGQTAYLRLDQTQISCAHK